MKRRSFIQKSLGGIIAPTFLSGFPISAFGDTSQHIAKGEENVLVIIQMSGGNDGLNTVIPLDKYDLYKNARSNIAIAESAALKIANNNTLGLHPSMVGLQELFKESRATLVQGVHYPNPSFSHFRATDIWNTASKANEFIPSGWVGRYLSNDNPNYPNNYPNNTKTDPLAIQIGSTLSTITQGPVYNMGLAISNPSTISTITLGDENPTAQQTLAGQKLRFLRTMADSTNKYNTTIKTAAESVVNQVTYPNTGLANQLKTVARMIAGGLKTKIYVVTIGGFDTHSNQVVTDDPNTGTHANLLKTLSDAIKAFMDDVTQLKCSDRVAGMTYSEFGRRIKSNASNGTDHGAALPLFVFGDKVQSKILGNTPNIPKTATTADNIDMQYDFRQVYADILENWLCLPSSQTTNVLGGSFKGLDLFKLEACQNILAKEPMVISRKFSNSPNPVKSFTNFNFELEQSSLVSVDIIDAMGRNLTSAIDNTFAKGKHSVYFDTSWMPAGLYYARMRNLESEQVIKILKR
jgi:uncharacterized protein (DUF1501 family)